VITTTVAVLIGLWVQPRLWCVFCPMGTMQSAIGGGKGQLRILGEACRGCRLCEQSCPLHLDIASHLGKGYLDNRDCLKCSEGVSACPPDAFSWPQ
jgi:ferredoxin-type protein NapH